MRILVVFNRPRQPGGEEAIEKSLRSGLSARHSVDYLDVPTSAFRNPVVQIVESLTHRRASRQIREKLKTGYPDLILCYNLMPFIGSSAIRIARQAGIPVVLSVHIFKLICANGFLFQKGRLCERCLSGSFSSAFTSGCWHDSRLLSGWMGCLLALQRRCLKQADGYILLSRSMKQTFMRAGFPADRMHVIPYFYDAGPRPFAPPAGSYFLFMGRLSREKGVDVLIDAAKELSDVPFKIAGDGEDEQALRRRAGGAKNIEFVGRIEGDQKIDLLRNCIANIVPSLWYEGQPVTILESYRTRKPVVASCLGGLPETVVDNRTGLLFEAGQSTALVRALRHLLADRSRGVQMGDNARDWLEQNASLGRWRERMDGLFKKVLG